jgi:hypothetical protein
MMNLTKLKLAIKQLTPAQREKLCGWLQSISTAEQSRQRRSRGTKKAQAGERGGDRFTYRKEMVRCGKEGCKCNGGKLHGPYWYAYWSEDGKTKSRYVGKRLPEKIEKNLK